MELKYTKTLTKLLALSLSMYSPVAFSQLVTNNGSTATIKPGCLVVVKNAAVNNAIGTIDNAGDFHIDQSLTNAGTITGGGAAGNFFVGGDWINNGTFTANQSQVELNGAAQQITGSNATTFYNLKQSGTGIKSQTINATVSNTLDLGSLELATNGNKMFVTNTATNAITFTSGFVSSTGLGRLSRSMNTIAPYIFPVGSSTGTPRYRPLEITPTLSGTSDFEVRMANLDATLETWDRSVKDTTICNVNPLFYHLIGRPNGTGPVNLKFFYQPANDGTFPILGHWQNLPRWEDMGTVANGTSGTFTTQDRNWTNFATQAFSFAAPAATLALSNLAPSYCATAAPVTLTVTPATATVTGLGVTGTSFNPATAGVGTHTLTITYNDPVTQCSTTKTRTVIVSTPPPVTITASGTTNFCEGQSVTLTANGATSYVWSNNSTAPSITVNAAASITVTGTTNGCSATSTATNVTVLPAAVPTITSSTGANTVCAGNTITLTSSAASGYVWTNSQTTQATSIATAGTYGITVTYANGCQATNSVVVTPDVPPTPQIVLDGPTTFCAGDNVILTTDVPYTSYQWNGYNSTLAFANIINSGTYSVTVTSAGGCTGTSNNVVIQVLALPNPTVTPVGTVNICAGNSTAVSTQTGFVSYNWLPSGGTANTATINQTGYYYATVTDNNGCTNTSDSVHVVVNSAPNPITITANGPTNFCEGNSVVLTAPGGFQTYTWSQGGTTQNIVVNTAGTYTCVVTNQAGCTPTSNSNAIVVNIFTGTPPTVSYSADTLQSSPAISYQWYLNGQLILGATNPTYLAQKSGSYYVVTTDANGCVVQSDIIEFTYVANGIEQIDGLKDFSVYPNPSEDVLTVELKFASITNFKIEFTDMLGNTVKMPDLIKNKDTFNKTYDIHELANGVYFMKLSAGGESLVYKVVKK